MPAAEMNKLNSSKSAFKGARMILNYLIQAGFNAYIQTQPVILRSPGSASGFILVATAWDSP
jgi:hypothetical protein